VDDSRTKSDEDLIPRAATSHSTTTTLSSDYVEQYIETHAEELKQRSNALMEKVLKEIEEKKQSTSPQQQQQQQQQQQGQGQEKQQKRKSSKKKLRTSSTSEKKQRSLLRRSSNVFTGLFLFVSHRP
jgi:hypothetical protein